MNVERRERRAQIRHAVCASAAIVLVHGGSRLSGWVLDLSLDGCRIRTDARFPVGIYTPVETEFCVEGLPFRLGGVVQGIYDLRLVGIRFLQLSERKRAQLVQLMGEIETREPRGSLAEPADAGENASEHRACEPSPEPSSPEPC